MTGDEHPDLCPHRVLEHAWCDRPTHPDEVYCGRHGGADPEAPRTTHHIRWQRTNDRSTR